MSTRNSLTDWVTMSLILALLLGGVSIRLSAPAPSQGIYEEGSAERLLVGFLKKHGFSQFKSVHYTEDAGIKGLQVSLPRCDGYMALLVLPDGDELVGLWQTLIANANYNSKYIFDGNTYSEFPRAIFWLKTMLHAVTIKMGRSSSFYPGPAFAVAYPKQCAFVERLPFNEVVLKGGFQ
ncbi:hypothetical protein LRP49_22475 [Enterovibrio sp. ZSDZ35]|uniref:Uncharacterized protein n=1 Tax=Enterovibrio qingdaonensis TaxID=2899818 RepID=A0ABT5QSR3_9GAMM|nr:hypothetical protein [Enterovibrio sp. ZSDZ35]MDD1783949.1 hypothetical protein [Enterovibrio sp. ZSDZ35]